MLVSQIELEVVDANPRCDDNARSSLEIATPPARKPANGSTKTQNSTEAITSKHSVIPFIFFPCDSALSTATCSRLALQPTIRAIHKLHCWRRLIVRKRNPLDLHGVGHAIAIADYS